MEVTPAPVPPSGEAEEGLHDPSVPGARVVSSQAPGKISIAGEDGRQQLHAMVDNVGLWWWRASANENGGDFCYVGRGRRYALGGWPTTDPGLFDDKKGC